MEHKETGCQAPEGPILCVNNCGFFGSAATMHMCSKCHQEMVRKQDQPKLAASSIDRIVNGNSCNKSKEFMVSGLSTITDVSVEAKETEAASERLDGGASAENIEVEKLGPSRCAIRHKRGPSRCTTCSKRVGLTGFSCKCGNLFCAAHRYSDRHNCPYDYRVAGQDAIANANPVIKAAKLDKI